MKAEYIGRFAPSPTGPLHIGSLVAAVGSYLQAKANRGKWLVRMEDLDPLREQPGAADAILRSLEAHGLHWDEKIVFQSERHGAYEAAIEQLIASGHAYPCSCSRKTLQETAKPGPYGLIYPGRCRTGPADERQQHAIRVRTHNQPIRFVDRRIGEYWQRLESEVGDFIIKRADGFFAYQLAVVVDDAAQGITEIVRGEDLLDNTPRQIHLQKLLGLPTPEYLHLPIVTNERGQKLSKQSHAPALENKKAARNLAMALTFLGLKPPPEMTGESMENLLLWGIQNWSIPESS